jgi:hypothetical protein
MSNVPGSPDVPQRRPLGRQAPSVPSTEPAASAPYSLLHEALTSFEELAARLLDQLRPASSVPVVGEVRTRRLVVVDEEDRDRVVVSADRGASVHLHTADPGAFLELSAYDGQEYDPPGPELALRSWLGGEQIVSHVAWSQPILGEVVERAQLAHEGDAGVDVVGEVERCRPAPEVVPAVSAGEALVLESVHLVQLVHQVVARFDAVEQQLASEAGGDDISDDHYVRSGSSRSFDLLLLAQELLRQRITSSTLSEAELSQRLVAEGVL